MSKFERWLLSYGPKTTRRRYSLALRKFCGFYNVTPDETLEWDLDTIEDNMLDWMISQRDSNYSGSTIIIEFAAVKQWFLFNRKRIIVKCSNISTTKEILDYIPDRADVQTLLDSAKLRHRVAIALFAFSGLRPIDQSEITYENVKASLQADDEVLTIIKKHRKTSQWYVTFLGPQGTGYIKRYLDARRRHGEKITDTSPILSGYQGQPLQAASIGKAITRIIKNTMGSHPTGESFRRFRPYSLRKYFRRTANKLGESVAEYLMGHREGLEGMPSTYGGLRDLDPQAIAALKLDYIKILPELETEVTDTTLRVQMASMEEKAEVREAELADIKQDVDEIRDFLRQLKEQEKG